MYINQSFCRKLKLTNNKMKYTAPIVIIVLIAAGIGIYWYSTNSQLSDTSQQVQSQQETTQEQSETNSPSSELVDSIILETEDESNDAIKTSDDDVNKALEDDEKIINSIGDDAYEVSF